LKIWNLPIVEILPFSDIEDKREVCLIYSAAALEAVGDLPLKEVSRHEVIEATEAHFTEIAEAAEGEVLYAVGGGVAVDAAKYAGMKTGLPVVSLPTAMTVDAFFTWASGIREDRCVRYVETGPPERVILDFDVLAAAPDTLRAAGICDVLSIATGSWDWRFARDRGHLDEATRYSEWADHTAQSILNAALDCVEAAGRGERDGLKQLIDCLALEVQLCNQIGHSRPEEGSEHYFAYSAEHHVASSLPHGDLVGPGILIAAHLQGQDITPLKAALNACRVPLMNIPHEATHTTLLGLAEYAKQHGLPYGIAHEVDTIPPNLSDILE